MRGGKLAIDGTVLHVLQRSADHLAELVEAARDDVAIPPEVTAGFLVHLDACQGDDDPGSDDFSEFEFAPVALRFDEAQAAQGYVIRFAPKAALYANGHEPALLIAALAELGTLEATLHCDALPDWRLGATEPALSWTLHLFTGESETTVQEVFEFVEGLCDLDIRPLETEPAALPEAPTLAEVPPAPVGTVAVERPGPVKPEAATAKAEDGEARGPKATLRVDLERVDRLINAVGELIINQAMISQRVGRAGEALAAIVDKVAHISTLVSDIAEGASQQSTGLGEINIGVTHLDQVTQQNAAMVEESSAASHTMLQEASGLATLVGHFRRSGEDAQIVDLPLGAARGRGAARRVAGGRG